VRHLGHVTILFSKRRPNDGPQQIKLIVTNLTEATTTGTILSHYHRRWGVEVAFKELKSGLHLGQMQVTKEAGRVGHSVALFVLAYLLLIRLYGRDEALAKDGSLFSSKSVLPRRWHRMPCSVLSGNGSVSSNNARR